MGGRNGRNYTIHINNNRRFSKSVKILFCDSFNICREGLSSVYKEVNGSSISYVEGMHISTEKVP